MPRPPPRPTLFPYTTLFRSTADAARRTVKHRTMRAVAARIVPALYAALKTLALAHAAHVHPRSEEHTSELQSHSDIVCRLLLEKKKGSSSQCSATSHRAKAP